MKLKRTICFLLTLTLLLSLAVPINVSAASKSKAIVIIPGIAGSKLFNSSNDVVWLSIVNPGRMSQLACNTNGTSTNTIHIDEQDTYGTLDTSKKLYKAIYDAYKNAYDIIFFSYDWRMNCATAASRLQTKLSNYSEVIIVAHSMGGLVASKYLSMSEANRNKVKKFISIGTPYAGAVRALYIMETGEFVTIPGINISPFRNTIKGLVCNFPAMYQLLPTKRYLESYSNGYIKNGTTQYTTHNASWAFMKQRNWGKSSGTVKPMFNTAINFHDSLIVGGAHVANSSSVNSYKIYGTGEDTISRVIYASDGTISVAVSTAGDSTVLTKSATNGLSTSNNRVYGFSCSHMDLAKNTSVINKVKDIISGNVSSSFQLNSIQETEKKRINFIAYNCNEIDLYTESGNRVCFENNTLFYNTTDGTRVIVGSYWPLGNNSCQYVLYDGKYYAKVSGEQHSNKTNIRIDYANDDVFTKSTMYTDIGDYSFVIGDNSSKKISCVDEQTQTMVEKTVEYSQREIAVMNGES